ncbi:malic enzyme-like NAD(P)-binding protein [Thalassotalea agarivorans]|uniref:NADP-dependent malic enzyme n=1 Tax=Thalassotalea agarivorans TaxID=349064 RepID=A0A1I0CGF4_THASX|nr:malic enzyme-like NAD(P)-binding protein [Thalassotalea agarivorans]SET18668.1 malate dehydrogenase (oxaloacetate-decarboxylating)(NADP+) [Thalassotalea agarivorans]
MLDIRQQALDYHAFPSPGKISIEITSPAETTQDLSLAYSPGVAEPVREIAQNPEDVYKYTAKGNTVAVISNGTAILGLGNLGPMASKPVMEGKALLFKRFANIDSFDIQVKHNTVEEFVATVANIADSFGGINLEDIKAPECFEIERALIAQCDVPVFHDDQHGTAIVTAAGLLNALEIQDKSIATAKIVCLGAGAAAIACMDLLIKCGANRSNIFMLDRQGVITTRRSGLNRYKQQFANDTDSKTLTDAIKDADVFVGVSGPNLLSAQQLALMASKPIVFACSNPDPEISPELVHKTRPDAIMATGRSDYPNQVNNVLCFPFIFRGALDVRATEINDAMKIAAVEAIRGLAQLAVPEKVLAATGEASLAFGPGYIIPKPMDERLCEKVAKAVATAAVESGVAKLPLPAKYQ